MKKLFCVLTLTVLLSLAFSQSMVTEIFLPAINFEEDYFYNPCTNSSYPLPPDIVCPTPVPTRNPYPGPDETSEPPPVDDFPASFLPQISKSFPAFTPTVGAPSNTGNLVIYSIFFQGTKGSEEPDEYVEIRNADTKAIQLDGWTLSDAGSNPHVFTFPVFSIQPDEACRVYTNETHTDSCGFRFESESAIWNNTGDCAYLRDITGKLISQKCY